MRVRSTWALGRGRKAVQRDLIHAICFKFDELLDGDKDDPVPYEAD